MIRTSRRKLAELIADRILAGENHQELLRAVAAYLVTHKQTKQAELLAADVALILAQRKEHVVASVTSARPLSEALQVQIKQYVASATGVQDVELASSVDPSILGGVIIKTPDAIRDTSVRSQLNALQV
jgi:F-type H+-transporting ATPase subunit delta